MYFNLVHYLNMNVVVPDNQSISLELKVSKLHILATTAIKKCVTN